MKERPIIFSDAMIRTILDGRKTQTRRVIKFEKLSGVRSGRLFYSKTFDSWAIEGGEADLKLVKCPYGRPGDRLWVREAWAHNGCSSCPVHYRATEPNYVAETLDSSGMGLSWRPSIHMPQRDSRITLEITDVRVERVASISETDAKAEGMMFHDGHGIGHSGWRWSVDHGFVYPDCRTAFAQLWDSIHGVGAWRSNPFVWVLSFNPVV